MTWLKVDDGLWSHRKVAALNDVLLEAMGLWTLALSWCGRELTDGYVPARQLIRLAGADVEHLAARLVEVGLWERTTDGYWVHDFDRYNPTREEVVALKETRSSAGQKGGQATAAARAAASAAAHGQAHAQADAKQTTKPVIRISSPELEKRAPAAGARARGAAAPEEMNGHVAEPDLSTTLTARQLAAWSTFGPEWAAFKAAWLARGFRLPPAGSPDDGDTSQRGLLWAILDARPNDLLRWVRAASGTTPRQVIEAVLAHWHEIRTQAGDSGPSAAGPARGVGAESIADIFANASVLEALA